MSYEVFIKIENTENAGDERWYTLTSEETADEAIELVETSITMALEPLGITPSVLDE